MSPDIGGIYVVVAVIVRRALRTLSVLVLGEPSQFVLPVRIPLRTAGATTLRRAGAGRRQRPTCPPQTPPTVPRPSNLSFVLVGEVLEVFLIGMGPHRELLFAESALAPMLRGTWQAGNQRPLAPFAVTPFPTFVLEHNFDTLAR